MVTELEPSCPLCGSPARELDPKAMVLTPKEAASQEHVCAIADLMRHGHWIRGDSHVAYSESTGISLERARHHATEAWRRVCAEATDVNVAKPTISGTLMVNIAAASNEGKRGDVARLADSWARVVGAVAPLRIEASVVVEEYARLPKDAQAAELRATAAALLAEASRLDAEVGVVQVLTEVSEIER